LKPPEKRESVYNMFTDALLYFIVMIFALLIGSFLNVLIFRLPRGESIIRPGSHCTSCNHKLMTKDLLPLFSYAWLRGRCRYCGVRISRRYPLVEILTAVFFLRVFLENGLSLETAIGCIFLSVLTVAAVSDMEKGIIPDLITCPGIIAGLFLSYFTIGIKSSLMGALAFSGLYILAAVISRGGMGGGDIKLAGLIGAFTGIQGALLVFAISALLGGIWALFLLLRRKAGPETEISFGPFLALAATMVWFYEQEIVSFYWYIIGQAY